MNVSQQIYNSIDGSEISLLVLRDPSKTFDIVNHDLLLSKLIWLNIDITWLESYLHENTYLLQKDKIMFKRNVNPFAVPQG